MPEAAATPASTPLLFGRYRVAERLGATRLATVYTATDERLQRRVLLHLLRKDLVGQAQPVARFTAQVAQMARRSHPALLEVYDSGEVHGRPFMISEYCTGRPLRGLGLLTAEQALLYLRQVTGAVAVCQARRDADAPHGLYHPPISSSNLLLVDEGRVKLVDSWHLPPGEVSGDLAHYRAPELSEGHAATPASTVYALGLLLYELLTGARPISGPGAQATALAHLSAQIPPLHVARPGLYLPSAEQLLARATARDPAQRFPDAQAFGAALDSLWRDLGATTRPLAPLPRTPAARSQPPAAPPSQAVAPSQSTARPGAARPAARGRRPAQVVNPAARRRQGLARGLLGWLVLIGLVALVATASYFAVSTLVDRLTRLPVPRVPGLPELPTADRGGPFGWLEGWFGGDELYLVNIADGLNLRREPDASDATNIIAVVPNGTPVRRLEGPRVEGGIPWLRVRVTVDGRELEGWMSLNYLQRKE